MINYNEKYKDFKHYVANIDDAMETFNKNTNKENRDDLLYAIGDLQHYIINLKTSIKNLYIPYRKER